MPSFLIISNLKSRKFSGKIIHRFWKLHQIIKGIWAKDLNTIILFADLSKASDSIEREKMDQIQLTLGLHKETVTAIMMFYKNTKAIVCSPDGDPDFFNIIAGVLLGYIFALYLFILCVDYGLQKLIDLIKEKDFRLKKARSRWYSVETLTDADYADDLALFANILVQTESPLHSREQAVDIIGLYVNANKTVIRCLKQKRIHLHEVASL